jgi:hypothetical protein
VGEGGADKREELIYGMARAYQEDTKYFVKPTEEPDATATQMSHVSSFSLFRSTPALQAPPFTQPACKAPTPQHATEGRALRATGLKTLGATSGPKPQVEHPLPPVCPHSTSSLGTPLTPCALLNPSLSLQTRFGRGLSVLLPVLLPLLAPCGGPPQRQWRADQGPTNLELP